jgi:hypothetical protein
MTEVKKTSEVTTRGHVIRWKSTDVSEEHIASIFRAENKATKIYLPPASTLKMVAKCCSEIGELTFNGLHGVTSQKTELFITTAGTTSDL